MAHERHTRDLEVRVHLRGTVTPSDVTVDFVLSSAHLVAPPRLQGQAIQLSELRTVTSPFTVEALDSAGIITSRLGDPTSGEFTMLGRLVELRHDVDGAGMARIGIGRLLGLTDRGGRTYAIQVGDERWQERQTTVFKTADTAQVYPPGIADAWWRTVAPASLADVRVQETQGSFVRVTLYHAWPVSGRTAQWVESRLREDAKDKRTDGLGNFLGLAVEIAGTDYPIITFDALGSSTFADSLRAVNPVEGRPLSAWIWAPAGVPAPPAGQLLNTGRIRQVDGGGPTSEVNPMHTGTQVPVGPGGHVYGVTNPFALLRILWDEEGIRYNAAAVQALVDDPQVPICAGRFGAPIALGTLANEIYALTGTMPFLDTDGAIAPRYVKLPSADPADPDFLDPATTFLFDASNLAEKPSWDHSAVDMVNEVRAETRAYQVVFIAGGSADGNVGASGTPQGGSDWPLDAILETKVSLEPVTHLSAADLGVKPVTLELRQLNHRLDGGFFGTLLGGAGLFQSTAEWVHRRRARDYLDRFGAGPLQGEMPSFLLHADGSGRTPLEDVAEGDFVRILHPDFADPNTNARGGVRLVQLLQKDVGYADIRWRYLDVGSDLQPVAVPAFTLQAPAVGARHAIEVNVSALGAGSRGLVRVGFGPTVPTVFPRTAEVAATGILTLGELPSGTRAWVQMQGVREGRVSSAWSAAQSIVTAAIPAPSGLALTPANRSIISAWTPGDAAYPVMPLAVEGAATPTDARTEPLPSGSTTYVHDGLKAATQYTIGVAHVDPWGGRSAAATATAVTGTARQLNAPRGLVIVKGRSPDLLIPELAPEGRTTAWGLELRVRPQEQHAALRCQVATDLGFSSIIWDERYPAGVFNWQAPVGSLDGEVFVRTMHEGQGFDDSNWSEIVSASTTALTPLGGPDLFAAGTAALDARTDGALLLDAFTDDPDVDAVYWDYAKNPTGPPLYPTVDLTSRKIERAAFPVIEDVVEATPGVPELVTPGDVVYATFRWRSNVGGFGQTTFFKLRIREDDFPDARPIVDEDNGVFDLVPYRTAAALSVRYLVTTDGSARSKAQVDATGTVSTAERIAGIAGPGLADGTLVRAFVVAYELANGTGASGELREARETFKVGNDRPTVSWFPFVPSVDDAEGVRLIFRDDGPTVEAEYRDYEEGSTPPAFTQTGQVADPHRVDLVIAKPAEGAPNWVVEFNAEDAEGNFAFDEAQRVIVDGNGIPSGSAVLEHNETTGETYLTVNTSDSDTGSYRIALAVRAIADTSAAPAIAFVDSLSEFGGTDFGARQLLDASLHLDSGQALVGRIQFYRTSSTVPATQAGSIRSPESVVGTALGRQLDAANVRSVAISFDEASDTLLVETVGGKGARSVRLEIDDDPAFGSPELSQDFNISEGQRVTSSVLAVGAGDRDKVWYGRAEPWTLPLNLGVVDGIAGGAKVDNVLVPPEPAAGSETGLTVLSISHTWLAKGSGHLLRIDVLLGTDVEDVLWEEAHDAEPFPARSGTASASAGVNPGTKRASFTVSFAYTGAESNIRVEVTPRKNAGATSGNAAPLDVPRPTEIGVGSASPAMRLFDGAADKSGERIVLGTGITLDDDPGTGLPRLSSTAGGAHALGDHTDVDTTGQAADEILAFDGASWVPRTRAELALARVDAAAVVTGLWDFNPTGSLPFTVAAGKTGLVARLNADQVDGLDAADIVKVSDLPLAATSGGTGLGTLATGDVLYASSASAIARRPIGSAGEVLTVSGGLPVWAAAPPPTGGAGGDLGGSYPNPSVQALQGRALPGAVPNDGDFLRFDQGTGAWVYSQDVVSAGDPETITGLWTYDRAGGAGTSPFAVGATNTGLVANLNADRLDGREAIDFLAWSVSGFWDATRSGGPRELRNLLDPTTDSAAATRSYVTDRHVDGRFWGDTVPGAPADGDVWVSGDSIFWQAGGTTYAAQGIAQ